MKRSSQTSMQQLKAVQAEQDSRIQEALTIIRAALEEGRAVSKELEKWSALLDRGIDISKIKVSYSDLPRLFEAASAIEAQKSINPSQGRKANPWRPSRRLPV
ncbi:MAG: hypothetical protein RLZZ602_1775 [Pseudomonadota bacterium]